MPGTGGGRVYSFRMAQPTRSGPSPLLPAIAGAIAAIVVVGGAFFLLRGDDGDDVAAVPTTTGEVDETTRTTVAESDDNEPVESAVPTTQRETEDTTNGTTIDDVPLSPLPDGAPETFVAVASDTFELVRVDSQTGAVIESLGSWGIGGDGPLQALQFVELAPNGTIYVDDCCEPAYGTTFIVTDQFDPGSTPQISGIGPELSPDGSRLARSSQGSAVSIADADGNEFGFFGDPDFSGRMIRVLTWIDNSRLLVSEESADGASHTLQVLDVSDPSSPSVIAERTAADHSYLAADVRADGNVLVVTRIENGTESGEVIAEVVDSSTAQVIVDFNLPDDVYDANYDASGRYVVTARSNGQLDWYGGGERGTLATGYISADW